MKTKEGIKSFSHIYIHTDIYMHVEENVGALVWKIY